MTEEPKAFVVEARRGFHAALFDNRSLSTNDKGIPSIADGASRSSVAIAEGILKRLGEEVINARLSGQMAGSQFEVVVGQFLEQTLPKLAQIRLALS